MASNIKKLPFPEWLAKTNCEIVLDNETISEDGEKICCEPIRRKCIFSECTKRLYDKDGKKIEVSGTVIIKGDIAPKLKEISSGTVLINDKRYVVSSASRPCNPDGTVHHTELNLL